MADERARVEVTVSTRTVLRVLALVAAFGIGIWVLSLVRDVLILLVISSFLAVALNPMVVGLERVLKVRRAVAVIAVVGVVGLLVVAFVSAILTPLYDDVREFVDNVPEYVEELRESRLLRDLDRRYDVGDRAQELIAQLPEKLPSTASSLLGIAGTVIGAVVDAVTVLFLTLFLLLELPRIGSSLLSLMAPPTAERARAISEEVTSTVARYVAGTMLIATIAGVVTYVSATLLGIPFPLVLALLVAVFDLIPLVGATIGLVIVTLVAFTQGVSPGVLMLVIGVVYQQVENNFIQPVVQRRSVQVSPVVVLVSVLLGAGLFGILGALLAIPFAASVQIALRESLEARRASVRRAHEVLAATEDDAPPAAPA